MPLPFLPAIMGGLKTLGSLAATKALPFIGKNILPAVLSQAVGGGGGTGSEEEEGRIIEFPQKHQPINIPAFTFGGGRNTSVPRGSGGYSDIIKTMLMRM